MISGAREIKESTTKKKKKKTPLSSDMAGASSWHGGPVLGKHRNIPVTNLGSQELSQIYLMLSVEIGGIRRLAQVSTVARDGLKVEGKCI